MPPGGAAEVRVLIAESQAALVEVLSTCIASALPPACEPRVVSSPPHADRILQHCRRTRYDLVILLLNNIIFPDSAREPAAVRRTRWLHLVAEVKCLNRCAIIALCGWMPGDPVLDMLHVTDAVGAGADFFFVMPPRADELIGAMRRCLAGRVSSVAVD
jgi:hypothetical protein